MVSSLRNVIIEILRESFQAIAAKNAGFHACGHGILQQREFAAA
jgi:hypothetical protein